MLAVLPRFLQFAAGTHFVKAPKDGKRGGRVHEYMAQRNHFYLLRGLKCNRQASKRNYDTQALKARKRWHEQLAYQASPSSAVHFQTPSLQSSFLQMGYIISSPLLL